MKSLLKAVAGHGKPRVIAVVGATREEVANGVAHAQTAGAGFPIRTWCAEDGHTAWSLRRELREAWPALTIVAWTGSAGRRSLKLVALTVPPFRVVAMNEARDFFPVRTDTAAAHAMRRTRDAARGRLETCAAWTHSILHRAGERLRDVGWLLIACLVEILAFGAKLLPPLTRRLMPADNSGGSPQVRSTETPALPMSYSEVVLSGRIWPAAAVRRALSERPLFLVFRSHTDLGDPRPLMDLAIETGSFAVARQSAYSGWRRQIVNRHPFRPLQAGEVAAVFAPWSTLMVVRADLADQLGMPSALTTGAALGLLYRKAAGEGWRSLVAGVTGPVSEEPAMPLEDAEIAIRLWKKSAPRVPSAARGNVASAPRCREPYRGVPRVLVVSPYLPYPLSHGGAVRIYNLCRAMAAEIDFVLACFHEAGEPIHYAALHKVFREVHVIDIDEKHDDPEVPQQVAEYRNSAMAHLIRELCGRRAVDLVQLEYTSMAEYRECTGQVPVILVEHDITFTLYEQLASPAADVWRDFERQALQCSNAVWTMSEEDRQIALAHGAPRRMTTVVCNGVDLERFRPEPRESAEPVILFVGSFRHLPNLLAFEALRNTIMPEVWREMPACRLEVIAGPDHERAARLARKTALLANHPLIAIQGFVEDVRPAYRDCDVVAVPLPVSAGTNIKVMEAMACGRAIVSTPVGCQGFGLGDGEELLIRDIGPEFAAGLIRLLRCRDIRERMAATARRAAEARFGWDAIARVALDSALSAARPLVHGASESESPEWHRSAGSAIRSRFESPTHR